MIDDSFDESIQSFGHGQEIVTPFTVEFTPLLFPLRTKPLCQFLQVHLVHPKNKLPSMDVVNGKDVVLVKDDLIALMHPMQPSLAQRIVHDTFQKLPRTLSDPNLEVLAPAT